MEQNRLREAEQTARVGIRLSHQLREETRAAWNRSEPVNWASDGHLLAEIYMRQGRYREAAQLIEGARAPYYHTGNIMNLSRAIAMIKIGNVAEARKSYKMVHILAYHEEFRPYMPDDSTARGVEATVFLGRGILDYHYRHFSSAAWALENALRVVPRSPLALRYYGKSLAALGQVEKSRRYFEEVIRRDQGLMARGARNDMAALGLALTGSAKRKP